MPPNFIQFRPKVGIKIALRSFTSVSWRLRTTLSPTLIKVFRNVSFRKRHLVALSEVERSVLGIKSCYLYDSLQIGNETKHQISLSRMMFS